MRSAGSGGAYFLCYVMKQVRKSNQQRNQNRIGKRLAYVLPVVCMLLATCGCGRRAQAEPAAQTHDPSQVVIAVDTEPETFDPTQGSGHTVMPLIQSTLVRYTPDMGFTNDLAVSYQLSDDERTWTFTIRSDAVFTDGVPVTAADVAFTLETAKHAKGTVDLTYMERAAAVDDETVVVTLSQPTSVFLHTLATLGIVPEHAYDADYGRHPIGSGAYRLVEWQAKEQLILEANEDYYGTQPAIRRVTVVFMSEDAAFAAVQAGAVDVAYSTATLGNMDVSGYHVESLAAADNRGMTLPVQPAEGKTTADGAPVGNSVTCQREIRQAVAYAVDRQAIADTVLHGFGRPAYSENDGLPWNNPAVALDTDIAYAEELLRENGWSDADGDGIVEKNGIPAEFTCIYPTGDSVRQAVALAVAEQVRAVGICIRVEGVSWDELAERMYSDAVLMGWGSTSPNETYYLYHSDYALGDDFYNPQGYASAQTDAYLEAAMHAHTQEEANAYWQKAQWDGTDGTAMQGACPWVWIVNLDHVTFVRDGLSIGTQPVHGHGHGLSLIQNLVEWEWTEE